MFEVGSSKRIIWGFFKIALAIAIRCFCPVERFCPAVPIFVLNPCGKEAKNHKY